MALTRPWAIQQARPTPADTRKQLASIYPREGVFPDPVTLAAAGIAYANGGWNVGARPFGANVKRGGGPFTQAYGSAQISNDATGTAWTIPAAPTSGSRIDRLWLRATDPSQGEAVTAAAALGEANDRAVPVYGVTSGIEATSPTVPALPAGVFEVAQVLTPSTATSIAQSTFYHVYNFAYVLGGLAYFWTASGLIAATSASSWVVGQLAHALDTGVTYRWSGTAWVAWESPWKTYSPTLTNFAVGTGGSAEATFQYKYSAGDVRVRFKAVLGTAGQSVGTSPAFTLPVTAATPLVNNMAYPGWVTLTDAGLAASLGVARANGLSDTVAAIISLHTGVPSTINSTSPYAWGAGDSLVGEFIYRPA